MNDIERQLRAAVGAPPPTEPEPVDPDDMLRSMFADLRAPVSTGEPDQVDEPFPDLGQGVRSSVVVTTDPAGDMNRVINGLFDPTRGWEFDRAAFRLGGWEERDGSITVTGKPYG